METDVIKELIAQYGYLAVYLGTFFEGETFYMLGGIAAQQGMLEFWAVTLVALAGGFSGDQFFFFLGRWKGNWLIARLPRLAHKAQEARRVIRRHAIWLMLLSRFLYGFRTVVPLACGTAGIKPWRFILLNFISALIWALLFGSLGYLAGQWIFDNLNIFHNLQYLVLVVAVVVIAGVVIGRQLKKRLLADDPEGPDGPDGTAGV